jgi:hypothetical protein
MFDLVKTAVNNFMDSIGAKADHCEDTPQEGFVSKISVKGDENYDIYLIIPDEKLKYISNFYFGEDEYDACDLTKEIANQIIGNAKAIAGDKNINFEIGIPEFIGEYKGDIDYDDILSFRFNEGKCFYILFRRK